MSKKIKKERSNVKEGIFKANPKGFGFVNIGEEEIHIAPNYVNTALDGDTVCVKIITDNSGKNKEGKIIKVEKRNITKVVGLFQNSRSFGFVVPDNRKINTDIFVSKKNFNGAKSNHKVVVEITKYPIKGKNAEGKVVEILGFQDEVGVDMLSLVKEHNLPYEFPVPVLEEADQIKGMIEKKDIPRRVDLRNETIFTIDGEDAKDLDDAVCVKKMENGNYLLGVHIADVSYYVKENSKIDREAYIRGTSVYMLDRVIPMLPTKLSNGICSLNAGKDRFTMSIDMEINK